MCKCTNQNLITLCHNIFSCLSDLHLTQKLLGLSRIGHNILIPAPLPSLPSCFEDSYISQHPLPQLLELSYMYCQQLQRQCVAKKEKKHGLNPHNDSCCIAAAEGKHKILKQVAFWKNKSLSKTLCHCLQA